MQLCCRCDLSHGHIAYAACGVVDGSAESFLIVRVDDDAEVADHILDLLTLVEGESPVDTVRDIVLPQRLLKDT